MKTLKTAKTKIVGIKNVIAKKSRY